MKQHCGAWNIQAFLDERWADKTIVCRTPENNWTPDPIAGPRSAIGRASDS